MDVFVSLVKQLDWSVTEDPLFLIAVNLLVATLVRILKPNVLTAALLGTVLIVSSGYLGTQHHRDLVQQYRRARGTVDAWFTVPENWPPKKGEIYPDLQLIDQDGNLTQLSVFQGKVLLIEPIGMSCPACVAFSGGQKAGPFEGVSPQPRLESIDVYLRRYGRVRPTDKRLIHVQLLLFNQQLRAPSADEVRRWAEHFGFERSENRLVLAGTRGMANPTSRAMIPGFQLVDKNFVLQADSTGKQPEDELFGELLPQVRRLLRE